MAFLRILIYSAKMNEFFVFIPFRWFFIFVFICFGLGVKIFINDFFFLRFVSKLFWFSKFNFLFLYLTDNYIWPFASLTFDWVDLLKITFEFLLLIDSSQEDNRKKCLLRRYDTPQTMTTQWRIKTQTNKNCWVSYYQGIIYVSWWIIILNNGNLITARMLFFSPTIIISVNISN